MAASELSEQIAVVRTLQKGRVVFCAVPNGGKRGLHEARMLKASGTRAGVPDLLIFSVPEEAEYVGVALEMKRSDGSRSNLSSLQKSWFAKLEKCGWKCIVGFGARDALAKLRDLGYTV